MKLVIILIMVSFVICFAMGGLIILLSKKSSMLSIVKSSPFECGFSPKSFNRSPFSVQFFLVALVFLIFDVELILFYPNILKGTMFLSSVGMFICIVFFTIMMVGLYHEWNQKSLEWN